MQRIRLIFIICLIKLILYLNRLGQLNDNVVGENEGNNHGRNLTLIALMQYSDDELI